MKTSPTKQIKTADVNVLWQIILVLIGIVYSLSLSASETELVLSPKQCVAVNQGTKCFVDVQITWKTVMANDYCLFSSQQDSPLHCWPNSNQGKFEQEFVSDKNIVFYLKQKYGDTKLMTKELKMVWIYKKNSRSPSSWRMF